MGNSHSTNVVDTKFTGKTLIDLSVPTPVQQPARKRHLGTTSAIQLYQERVNEQNRRIVDMIHNEKLKRGLCK